MISRLSWRVFVSFLVIATPLCSHETMIVNGGFETGELAPWFHRDNSPLNPHVWSISSQAHSGLFSATVYGNEEIRQNFAPISTESITELSFWVRHSTGPCLMYVELYGTGGGRQVIVTTTEWEKYDVTSWLTPGTSLTGFSIYGYSINDTYLDDVVLVPEPSVATLIGAACVLYALQLAWKLRTVLVALGVIALGSGVWKCTFSHAAQRSFSSALPNRSTMPIIREDRIRSLPRAIT